MIVNFIATYDKAQLFSGIAIVALAGYEQQKTINIANCGAKADGLANNAVSIQKAIDDSNAQGGGIVYIAA